MEIFRKAQAKKAAARSCLFNKQLDELFDSDVVLFKNSNEKEKAKRIIQILYLKFEMNVVGYSDEKVHDFIENDLKREDVKDEIDNILQKDEEMLKIADYISSKKGNYDFNKLLRIQHEG